MFEGIEGLRTPCLVTSTIVRLPHSCSDSRYAPYELRRETSLLLASSKPVGIPYKDIGQLDDSVFVLAVVQQNGMALESLAMESCVWNFKTGIVIAWNFGNSR